MSRTVPILVSYSEAFRLKVVKEIEKGRFSMEEARRFYEIGGSSTIGKWMKKFGRSHLTSKVVRIQMKDENDRIKQLKNEKKALESALAQTQMKLLVMEALVDIAKTDYGIDLKKKTGTKPLNKAGGK